MGHHWPASMTRPPQTPAAAISPGGLLDLPNAFTGDSWSRWRAILKAAWGEALSAEEEHLFREVAERDPPVRQVRELWCAVGRGGGKDSVASAIATVAALRIHHKTTWRANTRNVHCGGPSAS